MTFIVSLDPAQLRDWSAIAVIQMDYVAERRRFEYNLIAMNRKQGLPYGEIVDWATQVYKMPALNRGYPCDFIVDGTGVGVAVKDMLHAKGVRLKAITITAGESMTRQGNIIHLGKARLVGTFLGAFDAGKVHVNPNMSIWPQVEKEMLSFRAEMNAQGRVKMEAEPGENDDMLFALAMAVWYGEEIKRGKKSA